MAFFAARIYYGNGTTGADVSFQDVVWDNSAADGLWTNAANWTPADTPDQGDTVRIATGDTDIIGADEQTVTLHNLHLGPGFTAHLGSSTTSHQINADDLHIDKPVGRVWLDGTFTNVYIYDTAGEDGAVTLTGDITNLYIIKTRGTVVISDSTTLQNVYLTPTEDAKVRLTIGEGVGGPLGTANASGPALIRVHENGFCTSQSGTFSLRAYGYSEVTFTSNSGTDNPMDDLVMHGHAKVDHRTAGKITDFSVYRGGELSLADNAVGAVTVTGGTMYGGTVDFRNGANNVTLTNTITYNGGTLRTDDGTMVAI